MDFTACGLECGTRHEDSVYLYSASPFLLEADATHSNISLTCSYGQSSALKHYAWRPVEFDAELARRRFGCAIQNVVPHGKFVSPDGHFAAEYFHIDPGDEFGVPSVTLLSRIYPIDGQYHPHVTIGWVENWNIPSDLADSNVCWADNYYREWYLKGTDSANSQACLSGNRRFASSEVMWAFSGYLEQSNMCGGNIWQERTVVGPASLLEDISVPEGSELPTPDAVAWWNLIGAYDGIHVADSTGDLAVWNSAVYDYNFSAYDTVYFWTVLATTYSGSSNDILSTKSLGKHLITDNAIDCFTDCAYGRVGDANGQGMFPNEITLSDVMLMVDVCFISNDCNKFICVEEADVNQDGFPYAYPSTCLDYITLGDIMMLVDYLFITGPTMELPCTYN